ACRLRLAIADAAEAFYAHLDGITLDSLVCDNDALMDIFSPKLCSNKA
ncbi:MAG: Rrf2 family transcriptional regulator, partial [Rhodobacteraceae bacterium]|nr:Rrf2 family transcriptional regulator [Paracoccaceae bacterium]